jgi:carbamate kinase
VQIGDSENPLLVVALGGNAMQSPTGDDTVEADLARTNETAARLVEIVLSEKRRLVVTHGNGPQVGNHLFRSELAHEQGGLPSLPLDVCVADTQGGMAYVLQQCLVNAFHEANVPATVVGLVTQVVVDPDDPAFDRPSKPIGEMIAADRVESLRERGWQLVEDKHRAGWRRVVASPDPLEIVEAEAIGVLVASGAIVIAAGGGGIPVVQNERGALVGVPAVVDKDLASALLATDLQADELMILTDVEHAYVGYDSAGGRGLGSTSLSDARRYLEAGEFPAGSMGPKMEAICRFVESTGRVGIVTSIDRGLEALRGETGTRVTL